MAYFLSGAPTFDTEKAERVYEPLPHNSGSAGRITPKNL